MRYWLLVFLSSFGLLSGQVPKTADSLKVYLATKPQDSNYVQALNEMAFLKVQEGKYDEVPKIIAQIETLTKKIKWNSGYYKAMNMRGILEYSQQKPEKAMVYFLEAEKLIVKYKLPDKLYQNSLNNIMIIYNDMGNREKATEYAKKLIDFQEKKKLSPMKSAPYSQFGANLKFYKKYDEALVYFNKALAIEKELNSDWGIAIYENDIGNLYDDQEKYPEAMAHFKNGLAHAEKSSYKLLQTDLLINLARVQRFSSQFNAAEKNLFKAEKICDELEVTEPFKVLYQSLGSLYQQQKRYLEAERYFLKSLTIAKEMEKPEPLFTINHQLSELMQEMGKYKEAYQYLTASNVARDEIYKLETAQTTEDLLRKYEAEKKEERIKSLAAKNKISALEVKNATRQRLFLIIGLGFLVVIALLIFRQSRLRKKSNKQLQNLNAELDQANKVKARFLGILNHDLKSPLANLIGFLHLQKDNPELLDHQTREQMQDKTIASAEDLLESMEDILLWSKGEMDFNPESRPVKLAWVFDDLEKHFSHVGNVKITFENPGNIQWQTDEHYLKTILRNLTANAINAMSGTPDATVTIKAEGNVLTVSDNGPGADELAFAALYEEQKLSGARSGLGLHLVRDLAKTIGCKIAIESNLGVGTTFTLALDQKEKA